MHELSLISGEPIRLTIAEWNQVGRLPPLIQGAGEVTLGYAEGRLFDARDPGDPVMTYDEYLDRKGA